MYIGMLKWENKISHMVDTKIINRFCLMLHLQQQRTSACSIENILN